MRKSWTTNAEAIGWVLLSTGIFSLIFASGKFAGDSVEVTTPRGVRYFEIIEVGYN